MGGGTTATMHGFTTACQHMGFCFLSFLTPFTIARDQPTSTRGMNSRKERESEGERQGETTRKNKNTVEKVVLSEKGLEGWEVGGVLMTTPFFSRTKTAALTTTVHKKKRS